VPQKSTFYGIKKQNSSHFPHPFWLLTQFLRGQGASIKTIADPALLLTKMATQKQVTLITQQHI
jgi:hypothetical protein